MDNPKYKIGDIVQISKCLQNGYSYRIFVNSSMQKFRGKNLRITNFSIRDDFYIYKLEGMGWSWTEDMFELSNNKSLSIF